MHEAAIAQSLLDAILTEAQSQPGKPVAAKISCGAFSALNNEVLCFAFEAISKGTPCEGLKLDIEQKPIQAKCKKCGETFVFDLHRPVCTKCQCEEFELLPDAPLLLNEIEFDEK
ncbi:MAG: hydrogenase maturation nickel metallochaperone HypA [Sedimentisphaerales bacterium]|nr:hydrogenase maturation nickel metallochaperone HypA [Sedimentisphaerales bacterium]